MKKAGWTLVLVAAAVGTGLYMSRKPWSEFQRQRALTNQARRDQRAAEEDRAKYVSQAAAAESPTGREEIARERGYRRPNETPVEDLR